ncbi:hypothetical protein BDFB_010904 [Asbolus verrucosus]|uniref:Uncharacterized protein n=1 Tax=Asbolus verrucosus TaxID=1661398 RepID=A0A482W3V8_ASBVE|nr:hypothetical protein BDFB_010904 [Asbolus verrucosus]
MAFTLEAKSFMVESYFRDARKENCEWTYSIPDCVEEFREKFPQLKYSVLLFRQTGSVARSDEAMLLKFLFVTCHYNLVFLMELPGLF